MIKIYKDDQKLLLEYYTQYGNPDWINEKFDSRKKAKIAHVFNFQKKHLIPVDNEDNDADDSYTFVLGTLQGDYYQIDKDILGLKFDLLLDKAIKITRKTFVAVKDISIFRKIDSLIEEQIIIGGDNNNVIPVNEFENLLKNFPTTTTLDHFANARISRVLKDYLGTITDSQKKLEEHLKRQSTIKPKSKVDVFRKYEVEKYTYIYDTLKEMMEDSESCKESDWQKHIVDFLLLLFPKYIAVLENVHIKDYYSKSDKPTDRYIDLTLVDANGNIDIIEIKKPFTNCILSTSKYRDSYTPKKELTGAVMQIEKYLFHLNKWGINGEREINKKRAHELPNMMHLRITNPKGIIILGRDNDFREAQKFDLEIIKRKYANIVDIMTYDDLLRRLENIISKFKAKE